MSKSKYFVLTLEVILNYTKKDPEFYESLKKIVPEDFHLDPDNIHKKVNQEFLHILSEKDNFYHLLRLFDKFNKDMRFPLQQYRTYFYPTVKYFGQFRGARFYIHIIFSLKDVKIKSEQLVRILLDEDLPDRPDVPYVKEDMVLNDDDYDRAMAIAVGCGLGDSDPFRRYMYIDKQKFPIRLQNSMILKRNNFENDMYYDIDYDKMVPYGLYKFELHRQLPEALEKRKWIPPMKYERQKQAVRMMKKELRDVHRDAPINEELDIIRRYKKEYPNLNLARYGYDIPPGKGYERSEKSFEKRSQIAKPVPPSGPVTSSKILTA